MAKDAHTLLRSLPTLKTLSSTKLSDLPIDADIDEAFVPLPPEEYAFVREGENVLRVSGENGHDVIDYYGEYRGGYPYIDPALEKWAEKHGGWWEWENASNIGFYQF